MSFFQAIEQAKTVEDFICAVADLGDPETGSIADWDEQDALMHLEEIIATARRYQRPMDSTSVQQADRIEDLQRTVRALQSENAALKAHRL